MKKFKRIMCIALCIAMLASASAFASVETNPGSYRNEGYSDSLAMGFYTQIAPDYEEGAPTITVHVKPTGEHTYRCEMHIHGNPGLHSLFAACYYDYSAISCLNAEFEAPCKNDERVYSPNCSTAYGCFAEYYVNKAWSRPYATEMAGFCHNGSFEGDRLLATFELATMNNKPFDLSKITFAVFDIRTEESFQQAQNAPYDYVDLRVEVVMDDEAQTGTTAASFSDIKNHWGKTFIEQAAERGIFKGYDDGTFKPNKTMSMAELSAVLYNLSGASDPVVSGQWYATQKAWAEKNGVMKNFDATALVTREDFITMFVKTLKVMGVDVKATDAMKVKLATATDYATIAPENVDAIAWAVSTGLISGTSTDSLTINASSNVNRATIATMLMKYYNSL